MSIKEIKIGTRGSCLALIQAESIKVALAAIFPDKHITLKTIKTRGDINKESPLSKIKGIGIFTKEIEFSLLNNEIDIAVHSMKDLPTMPSLGLVIAAVPQREDARDAIVSRDYKSLFDLPFNAVVGTGSPRRKAQLLYIRRDIKINDLRGNLDTRITKMKNGDYDAIISALAALNRMNINRESVSPIDLEIFLPAPGQGCLAVQVRENSPLIELLKPLNCFTSQQAAIAERAFLSSLGGGCRVPIGAYAYRDGNNLIIEGMISDTDGFNIKRGKIEGDFLKPVALGEKLAGALIKAGGFDIT